MGAQLPLFDAGPRTLEDAETGTIRYYPSLIDPSEADGLFRYLLENTPWKTETMWMYDREVDVPRLVYAYRPGDALPHQVAAVKTDVEAALGERFNSVGLNYYRSERDSVAWHNDHLDELVHRPTIALLSLGATRRMQVRTKAQPRRMHSVDLEAGSLFVMSGRAQEFWEHTVAKSPRPSDARISVAFRMRRVQV